MSNADNIQLITRLKFLSKINKNEKVDTKNLSVQPADTHLTSIQRSYNQDSRQNTLSFIQHIINDSIKLIEKYAMSDKISEQSMVKHIVKDLIDSKIGIINLKYTYEGDTMFICNLETYLQNINAKIEEMRNNFPELFKNNSDYDYENDSDNFEKDTI